MATWLQIRDDFDLLDDWEDRYRYIIELGRDLPELDDALKTDATKVRGCVSQVWLVSRPHDEDSSEDPRIHFLATSDAAIVQGLIAILFSLYQDKTTKDILAIEADRELAGLGLAEHLTPQRSNGLAAMIERIRTDARALATANASSS